MEFKVDFLSNSWGYSQRWNTCQNQFWYDQTKTRNKFKCNKLNSSFEVEKLFLRGDSKYTKLRALRVELPSGEVKDC